MIRKRIICLYMLILISLLLNIPECNAKKKLGMSKALKAKALMKQPFGFCWYPCYCYNRFLFTGGFKTCWCWYPCWCWWHGPRFFGEEGGFGGPFEGATARGASASGRRARGPTPPSTMPRPSSPPETQPTISG